MITQRILKLARRVAWLCAIACQLLTPPALAADNKALAQELFDSAMVLVKQGNYQDACPKLEESQRLDVQIGTLFWLADCQQHIGKLASAWANFVDAADRAEDIQKIDHAKEARGRADALKVKLNKLLILVPDEMRNVPGLEIRRGDILLGLVQLGVPLPVDNGKHVIKVSATGRRTWSTTVEISGESGTVTVSIPPLKEEPEVGPVTASATSMVPSPPPSAQQPGGGAWSTPRKAAVGLGAAGVAGLLVGGVFGGLAADKAGASKNFCSPGMAGSPLNCTAEGGRLRQDVSTFANVSNVGLIGGGLLAAAGVVVWLVAPATDKPAKSGDTGARVAIAAGPHGAGLQIGGAW